MAEKTYDLPYRLVAVEDLEAHARELKTAIKKANDATVEKVVLNEEIVRLKRALEFYAEAKSYRPRGLTPVVPVNEDRGKKAREALGRNDR